ncbi:methylated-DNA--protein-cysteine methyltransferase, inducible [Paenibacillus montaniterrae]|uniref:methylated-DNA--[protein]-cysteine S-methyltransferase n=1 Tax=Paenibacillus montaniterrae TaxID=429341 RepID=A0A920CUF3_9BACL|nr:methylated-DNA--[protein]-cysteine S-methyltransferase [Paenibacillus montaniterrae]GIP16957.1 methylated-DNA--protein-cysteine methyltransferase, inducible [Paenibacillus montaniterrae]
MSTKPSETIYWSTVCLDDWQLHVAANEEGVIFVGSNNRPLAELEAWARAKYAKHTLVRDDSRLQPFADELMQYLQGKLSQFTAPVFYEGTPFQEAVWKALADIPYGETKSYSDIAQAIQKPGAVRAVGAAIGANPVLITIPCHRVIGKNGALTGYRGGMAMKAKLLKLEQQAP